MVFPKGRIERVKANCQFALHSRRDFYCFKASRRDMLNPSENQPRRNEGREEFFRFFLRALRFFVVDFHFFRAPIHCDMNDPSLGSI